MSIMIHEFKCTDVNNKCHDGTPSAFWHYHFQHVYARRSAMISSPEPLPYVKGRVYLLCSETFQDYTYIIHAYDESIATLNCKYGEFSFQRGILYPEQIQDLFDFLEDLKVKNTVFLPEEDMHV